MSDGRARDVGLLAGLAKHAELTSPGPGKLKALAMRDVRDIQREIIAAAVDAALQAQRAAIVAWLRARGVLRDGAGAHATNHYLLDAADAIERGEAEE